MKSVIIVVVVDYVVIEYVLDWMHFGVVANKQEAMRIESEVQFKLLQSVHKVAPAERETQKQHRCCCLCTSTNTNTQQQQQHTKTQFWPMHVPLLLPLPSAPAAAATDGPKVSTIRCKMQALLYGTPQKSYALF